MNLGFTTVTFRDKSIEEIFEIAKDNNIKLIEWAGDCHLPYNDKTALEKIIKLQNEYGISSNSYGSYYKTGENDFEKFQLICETAKAVGAKIVRIWLGEKGSKFSGKKYFNQMILELQKLCAMAKKYDLVVAGEFHQKTFNDSYKSAKKVLNACGCENYKTYWQPLGNTKKDMTNLETLLNHIVVVHVFNWKNYNNRYLFSEKSERWQSFFNVINKNNKIPLIMEFVKDDDVKNFKADVKTICEMIGEEYE